MIAFRRIIVVSAGVLGISAIAIGISGLRDHVAPADLAVVLGNKVYPDGRVSARLQARLNKAVDLYRDKTVPLVLVSGGSGPAYDEARSMRGYLIDKGIPSAAIRTDSLGKNTFLTAQNTAALMRDAHLKTVIVVSQFYHLPRARLAMRKAGLHDVYWAHANYFAWHDVYALAREVVAFYVYALRY
jgi:vancomycin permeability regulator SanA